jgi:signal transduction histidine kinase
VEECSVIGLTFTVATGSAELATAASPNATFGLTDPYGAISFYCCDRRSGTIVLMRLADFILENIEPILQEWEAFARSLSPGATMDVLALRNDAEAILLACARDMRTQQSGSQQASKSKGHGGAGGATSDRLNDASSVHGVGRVGSGFNLNEVVSEYRALRASVLRLWRESAPASDDADLSDITRFNEAIDQSLGQAVESYTHRVDQSRRMFLAILSHDLRNPLGCISMSARLASSQKEIDPQSSQALSQIETSVQAISRLVQDLLDFAAAGLGATIPLVMAPVNLQLLGREVLDELNASNPRRSLQFDTRGDLTCLCDGPRLRQVISNLLGNALEHGSKDDDVELSIVADGSDIVLTVRNQGPPISADLLPTIFDPLVRDTSADAQRQRRLGSVGLGLYIAREIVAAHGGKIDVESSAELGTVFTVRIPCKPDQQ